MNRTEKLLEQLLEKLDTLNQAKNSQSVYKNECEWPVPALKPGPKDFWGIPRCGHYEIINGQEIFIQGYGD